MTDQSEQTGLLGKEQLFFSVFTKEIKKTEAGEASC